jgi:hypothetical protein
MNPAPAVIAASLVCGSWQTATSTGSLALGCWYNGMMRCTRRRLYGLSGKDQQELVARIEAFYRNGWPGSAKSGHRTSAASVHRLAASHATPQQPHRSAVELNG